MAILVSSVPLPLTIIIGRPRRAITASSSRPTRAPDREVSATLAAHCSWHRLFLQFPQLRTLVAELLAAKAGESSSQVPGRCRSVWRIEIHQSIVPEMLLFRV